MIIVAISGGTGSGKTTLSKKILNHYGGIKSNYLSLDSYYKDFSDISFSERSKINFDSPDSIDFELFYQHLNQYKNGIAVKTPCYSYKRHKRLKKTKLLRQGELLILDGILILLKKNIREFFDLSIFLDVDSNKRLQRRIKRDIKERGRSEIEVSERFTKMIEPMHEKHVNPCKLFADIIVDNNCDFRLIQEKIDRTINGVNKKN